MDKIGKYEIIDKIGEGGFGVVYKGKDPFIKRLVAVKTCSSENADIQKRFFREAEIAGNLHHTNVVTIHDFGIEGTTPYLVQEFLSGDDLDVVIKKSKEPIPLSIKVRYLRGIAEGLNYAHAQGVIHRDIKPANIRILDNDRVKVMDFGIAKLKDQESQLTQTGMTLGTVAYLSPEQLRGQDVDYRADIFSYGILAYELISGQRPFRADTIHSLFYQLLNEPAQSLEELDEGVPGPLNEVIQKCLAKTPEERYASFSEVIADLGRVQNELGDDDNESTDLFMPSVPSGTESTGSSMLAAKARAAMEEGDLTAAELTINMARRDYSSEEDFRADFAALEAEVESLKQDRDTDLEEQDTLERPSASPERKQQELPLLKLRVESLLQEGELEKAEAATSAALAELGPDTVISDLMRQIQKAQKATAAATEEAPKEPQPPRSTSVATPTPSPAPPPVTPTRTPEPVLSRPSPAATSPEARRPPWLWIGVAGVVGMVALVFLLSRLFGGDDPAPAVDPSQDPTQLASNALEEGPSRTEQERNPTPTSTRRSSGVETPTETGETPSDPQADAATSRGAATPEQEAPARTEPERQQAPPPSQSTRPERTEPPPSRTQQQQPSPARSEPQRTTRAPQRSTPERSTPERTPQRTPARSQQPSRQATPPRNEPQPKPAQPEAESFSIQEMEEQASIRQSIDVWRDAWISLDHNLVNDIFPSANLRRSDMRALRTAEVSVGSCSFEIDGASATALCPISRVATPKRGDPQTVRLRGFRLQKSGSRWVIAEELR